MVNHILSFKLGMVKANYTKHYCPVIKYAYSRFGGLEVVCWPLVPKFAGSHPAEAVGFLGRKKSSARLLSEGK